jgi:translin
MKNLEKIVDEMEIQFDEMDNARELCLKSSRTITRLASRALRHLHRGEDVQSSVEEAREEVSRLRSILTDHQELLHSGFVEQALQEFTEVVIVDHILKEKMLPSPKEIGVPNSAYLLGLGDVVGELRRETMEHLRKGDLARATRYLEGMEEIYDQLMRFDHPSAIVPIRRKQDVARTLIEKTRGEIAVATRGKVLEDKMAALEGRL